MADSPGELRPGNKNWREESRLDTAAFALPNLVTDHAKGGAG